MLSSPSDNVNCEVEIQVPKSPSETKTFLDRQSKTNRCDDKEYTFGYSQSTHMVQSFLNRTICLGCFLALSGSIGICMYINLLYKLIYQYMISIVCFVVLCI